MLLDDFVLLKKLGEGAFATVWAARRTRARPRPGARDDDHDDHDDHDDDGRTLFAVKHLKRKDAPGSSLNGGRSLLDSAEFRALRVLPRHANVLRAVQVARERGVVFLVTEWCDSNLLQLIDASRASGARALSEPVVARATRQLLSALAHCHARAWAHRDVKPENVLVKDGVAKLADFGEACEFASDDARTSYVGTRWYRAPEQFIVEHARRARRGGGGGGGGGGGRAAGDDADATWRLIPGAADVWAAGCVMAECAIGRALFRGVSDHDMLRKIADEVGDGGGGGEGGDGGLSASAREAWEAAAKVRRVLYTGPHTTALAW
jgi:serine/threonine protein kinase